MIKEVPIPSEDGNLTKTKVVETTYDLPSRDYTPIIKDFLHATKKANLNIADLQMEQKLILTSEDKESIPHVFLNSVPNASTNFTSNWYPLLRKNKDLFRDNYIHMNANFDYLGKPKHLTSSIDLSSFLMQIEPVLTSALSGLVQNCGSHVEAVAYMFIMVPGFSGEGIAAISKVLELDPINFIDRPDVIQLNNFLERVNNEALSNSFYALHKELMDDIYVKDETTFHELKKRLSEIKVHSCEIENDEKILVFESSDLGLFKKNRAL